MTRFIQILLTSEFVFVEIPATVLTLIAVHNLTDAYLVNVTRVYIAISAVLLPIVCIIVPGLYLYLACCKFQNPSIIHTY
jgi:hypothetical protein